MSVPYLPRATFSIYSDDEQTLIKAVNNSIYAGNYDWGTFIHNYYYIMQQFTPKNIIPKIFYYKTANPNAVNCVVVSNVICSDHYVYETRYLTTTKPQYPPEQYSLQMKNLKTTITSSLGNTIYYGASETVEIDKINPAIPIFDTFQDGVNQSDLEGWKFVNPANPYEFDPDAISYAGGGNGKFDNTSDTIGVPSLPTLSAVSAGFVTMYSPSVANLNALANFLWTDNAFDPANFKKLFTDPMECIIGLTIVPVAPQTSGSSEIRVGYVGTGVSASKLSSQYAELSCGTINAEEFWGSYLDYSPFTKIHIYLPYIGIREINADDVMNKTIGVTYHVDLLSGACTAFVTVGGSVLYQFNGQCSINVPMAASNFTEMIHSAISAIGSVAMTASGAGAASSLTGAAAIGTAAQMGANAANSASSSKPSYSHSGQMGGSGGMLAVQTPYLIIERPRQCVAEGVNAFEGFPSNINYKLYDLSGYTVVESIHLDGFTCTDNEAAEILSLLKGGVIL